MTIVFEGVQRINWSFFKFFLFRAQPKKSKAQQHDEQPNHGTDIGRRHPLTADTTTPMHTIYCQRYCGVDQGAGAGLLPPWPPPHRPQHHALCQIGTMMAVKVLVLGAWSQQPRSNTRILLLWSSSGIVHQGLAIGGGEATVFAVGFGTAVRYTVYSRGGW